MLFPFFFFFIPVDLKLVMKIIMLGPAEQKHSITPNLAADPSFAFNNCRHTLALLCDHA